MGFETVWGIGTGILSIVLTVMAWRKGWGPRAVLPIIIATLLDLGVGAVLGESTPTAIAIYSSFRSRGTEAPDSRSLGAYAASPAPNVTLPLRC